MSVVIDGTNGVTASASFLGTGPFTGSYSDGIVADYTTGVGRISVGASDAIAFYRGGIANTESMRLDSSGNLGIGTSSPSYTNAGRTVLTLNGSTDSVWTMNYGGTVGLYAQASSTDGKLFTTGTLPLLFGTGSAERMRIDSSGNLLVGTTSAGATANAVWMSPSTSTIRFDNTTASGKEWSIGSSSPGVASAGDYLSFARYSGSAWAEVARIDSSGNFLVGTTSTSVASGGLAIQPAGGETYINIGHKTGTSSGAYFLPFSYNGTIIGGVTQNGTTGVLYNLTSDYRLKSDPQPLTGSKEFVMALQPKKWQWWDGSGEGVGFIAHEFMEVAKYSGNGEKDAVDEEGNPVYQSIQPSSSEVMANLVALLQEQQAIIEQLQADVAALKG